MVTERFKIPVMVDENEVEGVRRTDFNISKMDCPSEEQLVRMALSGIEVVKTLSFDLVGRKMSVVHSGSPDFLMSKLVPLKLGVTVLGSQFISAPEVDLGSHDQAEARVLKQLLAVNFSMFGVEVVIGFLAQSTGLIADSFDMFADAAVYALSLYAVGKGNSLKLRSAKMTGYFQLFLATGTLSEVARRTVYGSEPEGALMMGVSIVALAANVLCLALLMKHRTGGVHMRATYICSSTDVIANAGVIVAGFLVLWTGSAVPDLAIGGIIALVVAGGGLRILRVAKPSIPRLKQS